MIGKDEYKHACNEYEKLKCKTFRDYHDIYIFKKRCYSVGRCF